LIFFPLSRKIFVEDRQVPLDATSDPPALFDGTTRLYISYTCPFAQRVWITRNLKVLVFYIFMVYMYVNWDRDEKFISKICWFVWHWGVLGSARWDQIGSYRSS